MISVAKRLEIGTKLSLKIKVRNVINTASNKDGKTIRELLIPKLFKANISEFEESFPYVNKLESKTDMGNASTKKLGRLKKKICKATKIGRPNSTIFLIRSNITPTESDTIVKAEIAKNKIGISLEIIHLSKSGICLVRLLKVFKYFVFFKMKNFD